MVAQKGGICSCQCHNGPHYACDINGGCGSQHTTKTRTDGCWTCPVIRPDSEPRQPHQPPVCDGDRQLLHRWLGEINTLVDDLTNPEGPIVDDRHYHRWIHACDGWHRYAGYVPADPVAGLGGVAPINSRSKQPSVTGSKERPLPINTSALDLTADARVHNPTPDAWPEDQIGHLSAATVLDEWIRDTRDRLLPDHHLPPATVSDMVRWLRTNLETICDRHPQVADFTEALRILRGALRATAGQSEQRPEPCTGVPCKQCDLMTLYREPGGDVACGNPDCNAVLRDDEYSDWVKTLAAEHHTKGRISAPR